MTRKQSGICLALILAFWLASFAPSRAETYAELFIGGVHTENEHIPFSLPHRYPGGGEF